MRYIFVQSTCATKKYIAQLRNYLLFHIYLLSLFVYHYTEGAGSIIS